MLTEQKKLIWNTIGAVSNRPMSSTERMV